jgi:hypothetical protein
MMAWMPWPTATAAADLRARFSAQEEQPRKGERDKERKEERKRRRKKGRGGERRKAHVLLLQESQFSNWSDAGQPMDEDGSDEEGFPASPGPVWSHGAGVSSI